MQAAALETCLSGDAMQPSTMDTTLPGIALVFLRHMHFFNVISSFGTSFPLDALQVSDPF